MGNTMDKRDRGRVKTTEDLERKYKLAWVRTTVETLAAIKNATAKAAGFLSAEDKVKLDNIEEGANKYVHPSSHPASMITEDETHRFTTDADKKKLNGIEEGAKVNVQSDWNATSGDAFIKNKPSAAGDSKTPIYWKNGKPNAVSSVDENLLSWGKESIAGGVSIIDSSFSDRHKANRYAFANPAGITVEKSTNGTTFVDYGATDKQKTSIVSGIGTTFYVGGRSGADVNSVNDKVRITLNAGSMGVYTQLRKLLINISTNNAKDCTVLVEKAMNGSETTFTEVGTFTLKGWSGWNSIPINTRFGGKSESYISVLRLTFSVGTLTAGKNNALEVLDILCIGEAAWTTPSNMAKTGHMYTYDHEQNVTFPAGVTATGVINATNVNSHIITATCGSVSPKFTLTYDGADGGELLLSLNAKFYKRGVGGSGNTFTPLTPSGMTVNAKDEGIATFEFVKSSFTSGETLIAIVGSTNGYWTTT